MLRFKCCYFSWGFDSLYKTLSLSCCWPISEGPTPHSVDSCCLPHWRYRPVGNWVHETLKDPSLLSERDPSKARNQSYTVEEMKAGNSYTWYCDFSPQVYLFYRRPQSTYLHTLLKMLPKRRTSRRSVFLLPLYCTHNWYFCHLCLLLKLSMKVFWDAWLYLIQNWTVNLFNQKYLY